MGQKHFCYIKNFIAFEPQLIALGFLHAFKEAAS